MDNKNIIHLQKKRPLINISRHGEKTTKRGSISSAAPPLQCVRVKFHAQYFLRAFRFTLQNTRVL